MPPTIKLFALSQQPGSEGQAVEILLVGQRGGSNGVELGQGGQAPRVLTAERLQRGGIKPTLATTQADVGGVSGMLAVKCVKVIVEQRLKGFGG